MVVIAPKKVSFPKDSFMTDYLGRLESNRRILRLQSGKLVDFTLDSRNMHLLDEPESRKIVHSLVKRLGWVC